MEKTREKNIKENYQKMVELGLVEKAKEKTKKEKKKKSPAPAGPTRQSTRKRAAVRYNEDEVEELTKKRKPLKEGLLQKVLSRLATLEELGEGEVEGEVAVKEGLLEKVLGRLNTLEELEEGGVEGEVEVEGGVAVVGNPRYLPGLI